MLAFVAGRASQPASVILFVAQHLPGLRSPLGTEGEMDVNSSVFYQGMGIFMAFEADSTTPPTIVNSSRTVHAIGSCGARRRFLASRLTPVRLRVVQMGLRK